MYAIKFQFSKVNVGNILGTYTSDPSIWKTNAFVRVNKIVTDFKTEINGFEF